MEKGARQPRAFYQAQNCEDNVLKEIRTLQRDTQEIHHLLEVHGGQSGTMRR